MTSEQRAERGEGGSSVRSWDSGWRGRSSHRACSKQQGAWYDLEDSEGKAQVMQLEKPTG